jgi:carboxymethylenebutenolidase
VAPTGKRVEIPLVAIVRFRDGKLAHEHIYWDQASVLVQIGLLDPAKLPAAGVESARKVLDPSLPANTLIKRADKSQ